MESQLPTLIRTFACALHLFAQDRLLDVRACQSRVDLPEMRLAHYQVHIDRY